MPTDSCITTIDTEGTVCITCTGQPAVPTIPPHIVIYSITGWNAGANSVDTQSHDFTAEWQVEQSLGIVVGVAPSPRPSQVDPSNLPYAWFTTRVNGALFAQPMESGVLVSSHVSISGSSTLKIRRVDGRITYRIDSTDYFVSETPSFGEYEMGACQYVSGDTIA